MEGVDLVDQQVDRSCLDRILQVVHRAVLTRYIQKARGEEEFLYFFSDVCTQLPLNLIRLRRSRRTPRDNSVKYTGRNHWPPRRGSPGNWKRMQPRKLIQSAHCKG